MLAPESFDICNKIGDILSLFLHQRACELYLTINMLFSTFMLLLVDGQEGAQPATQPRRGTVPGGNARRRLLANVQCCRWR